MSAVITGAVVGAVIASSAVHSGPSEPMSQITAIFLLAVLAVSLCVGGICAYRSRWEKWEAMLCGTVGTVLVVFLLLGLVALIAVAVGV